ncbi:hypothetical protein [Nocardia wallacei]|uniref:Uncharacterized protein n=1 Tax=Nocardia wallacei TaxID=480035 RepID=A0A7G1KS82_9NOCA|nr:hypothetical protein [Nocardia wallacei]BCK57396.1 hypothetical protein NWFMUON74_51680 [Nocardia wallacei]
MEREHEEAMRREFAERVELNHSAYRSGVTEQQMDALYDHSRQYNQRWLNGPHAEHWQFLDDAYHDWRDRPDTMRRLTENLRHGRATGDNGGFTDVQYRSVEQAGRLVETERTRSRAERGR